MEWTTKHQYHAQALEDWKKHYRDIIQNPNNTPQIKEQARKALLEICEEKEYAKT